MTNIAEFYFKKTFGNIGAPPVLYIFTGNLLSFHFKSKEVQITCRAPFSWCARQNTFIIKQLLSWLSFHACCVRIYPSLWTALIWSNAYSFEVTFFEICGISLKWSFEVTIFFALNQCYLYWKTTRMKLNVHKNISLSKIHILSSNCFHVYINRLENIKLKIYPKKDCQFFSLNL